MEFKPKSNSRDDKDVVAPEKGRPLRRKTAEKLHQSYNVRRRILGVLQWVGKLCVVAAAIGILIGSIYFAYTSQRFAVRNITFEGTRRADTRKLEAIIRSEFPSNILRIDLPSLCHRIGQEPWIKRVAVRRILPSDLIISVEERAPAAIVEVNGELMVADNEGILLDTYPPQDGKLDVPVFKGVLGQDASGYRLYQEENTARVQLGLKLLADLEAGSPSYVGKISEVDLSEKSNLKVLLMDAAPELILGDRDFLKRFRRFVANPDAYQEARLKFGEMISADLRFDGEIVYHTRRSSSVEAPPEKH